MPLPDTVLVPDFSTRFISYDEWRKAARAGDGEAEVRPGLKLSEAIVLAPNKVGEIKSVNLDDGTAEFTVSTGNRDRDRDAVNPKGWDLTNFKKNPVVLWAHESWSPPVARATRIARDGDELVSTAKFYTEDDDYRFPRTVLRMLQGRFLNAVSAGFMPLEWVYNEDARGFDIKRQELYEYSVVPVPANPEALQRALKSGIDLEPFAEWAVKTLDAYSVARWSTSGLWVPREAVESVVKDIVGLPFSLTVDGFAKADRSTTEESMDLEKLVALVNDLKTQVEGVRSAATVKPVDSKAAESVEGPGPEAATKLNEALTAVTEKLQSVANKLEALTAAAEVEKDAGAVGDAELDAFLAGIGSDQIKAALDEGEGDPVEKLFEDMGVDRAAATRIFEAAVQEVATKAVDDAITATTGRLPD